MSLQSVADLSFDFLPSRPVEIEISSAPLSSDAGLLAVRQFDDRIRLTEQFAGALRDTRDPAFTKQALLVMVRQRIFFFFLRFDMFWAEATDVNAATESPTKSARESLFAYLMTELHLLR